MMDMKRTGHTPEQIIRKLREADQSLVENILFTEVMRHLEVSDQMYHPWRSQYGRGDFNGAISFY